MRRSLVSIVLPLAAMAALAQGPPPAGRGRGRFGPDGGPGARFLGGEPGMPGRVVKNAPFIGDLVTETTQTLSDGNHIRQSATAHLARDSEGRTRREQSLNGLGPLGTAGDSQAIFIYDPVAGVSYALNPSNHTVARMDQAPWGRAGGRNGKQSPPSNGGRWARGANGADIKSETLGKQNIEGVQAEGIRTTQTIPAGQMGNELPLQVVIERWYSADLQMDVLTRRTDPRTGETVTKLMNISRAEPSHTLFEPPADYKVQGAGRRQTSPQK